jgi:nitroreductase
MSHILDAIFQRRAVKVFDPVEISPATREQIMNAARVAPSSFNIQPYRFYWIETPQAREKAAKLCMNQAPAVTASALVVAVADLGSWQSTTECVQQDSLPRRSTSWSKNPSGLNGFSSRGGSAHWGL